MEKKTTCNLSDLDYDQDQVLRLENTYQHNGRIYILRTRQDDDGTWPRVSDFKKFANKLQHHDTKALQNFIVGKNRKADWGFCVIKKANVEYPNDGLIIQFKNPITVKFGQIGETPVTAEVKELKGELNWEPFFYKRNNTMEIEIYLKSITFLS